MPEDRWYPEVHKHVYMKRRRRRWKTHQTVIPKLRRRRRSKLHKNVIPKQPPHRNVIPK